MARRVVIGAQSDNVTMGLRCSAPGFDALTATDDGHSITFDSSWSDIAKVYVVGLVSWAAAAFGSPILLDGFVANWSSPGYVPFVELRRLSGTIIFDDLWLGANPDGIPANVEATRFTVSANSTSDKILYIVYNIAVPAPT